MILFVTGVFMTVLPKRRSNEQRKLIFNEMKKRKCSSSESRRLRDWTKSHINVYLKARNKPLFKNRISGIYILEDTKV